MVYFFLSDESLALDGVTAIDPSATAYSGGIYFETQMTNKIYTSSELKTSINNLSIGDKRLIVTYGTDVNMDSTIFRKVLVFNRTAPSVTNDTLSTLGGGTLFNQDVSSSQSGTFTLSGLNNNSPYTLSVALEDNFLFATTMSPTVSGTPIEIQELLKKQACYILTAGFGEEHYITNYFRGFRDRVLAKNWLGRLFIKSYYKTAPHYAIIIYQSDFLRWIVRCFAYTLYFLFHYGLIILLFWVLSLSILKLRKNKVLISE
jgi:hypothetical protein